MREVFTPQKFYGLVTEPVLEPGSADSIHRVPLKAGTQTPLDVHKINKEIFPHPANTGQHVHGNQTT